MEAALTKRHKASHYGEKLCFLNRIRAKMDLIIWSITFQTVVGYKKRRLTWPVVSALMKARDTHARRNIDLFHVSREGIRRSACESRSLVMDVLFWMFPPGSAPHSNVQSHTSKQKYVFIDLTAAVRCFLYVPMIYMLLWNKIKRVWNLSVNIWMVLSRSSQAADVWNTPLVNMIRTRKIPTCCGGFRFYSFRFSYMKM